MHRDHAIILSTPCYKYSHCHCPRLSPHTHHDVSKNKVCHELLELAISITCPGSSGTCSGTTVLQVFPRPSCPNRFQPHANAVWSSERAILCLEPATTCSA